MVDEHQGGNLFCNFYFFVALPSELIAVGGLFRDLLDLLLRLASFLILSDSSEPMGYETVRRANMCFPFYNRSGGIANGLAKAT